MNKKDILIIISGIIFGVGLAVSNMAKPEVVLSFLELKDFGLLLVMVPAAILSGIVFAVFSGKKAPWTKLTYGKRDYPLGKNTVLGGIFFGLGWGISGLCPGAAYASIGMGNYPVIFAVLAMSLGATSYYVFAKKFPKNKLVVDHDKN